MLASIPLKTVDTLLGDADVVWHCMLIMRKYFYQWIFLVLAVGLIDRRNQWNPNAYGIPETKRDLTR